LRLQKGSGGYLAFLGRISPEKGVDQAIEIARRAGVPLKIAAKVDHGDRGYFENYIKPLLKGDLVEFIGEIGHDEKNAFLGNAAALLFPICWPEPFGLVMIEALACGTPVIAYRHGSVPEVLEDGVTGFIVQNVSGAVDAVKRLDEINRKVCRDYFDLHFSDERMALEYMAIYEKLVRTEPSALTMDDGVLGWTDLLPNSTT
jgi:glycosyltransferase involved in cell wall biosynthesis